MHKITRLLIKLYYNKISKRRLKLNINNYLDEIDKVLKYGNPWRSINHYQLHYTTFYKFFNRLVRYNIFKKLHNKITKMYYKKNNYKNLFIDSTMIKNINGHDFTGANHYDRNRKGNKISVIVNDKGIPISLHLSTSNIHDSKLIEKTINNTSIQIISSRLIADKGYINSKLKRKLKKKKISLIYPYRKNQKKNNTTFEKNLLKGRYIVENYFGWLKQYRRVQQRYDSIAINYMNFIYLASINLIIKKIY